MLAMVSETTDPTPSSASGDRPSVLQAMRQLKEQILEKDRMLREKTNEVVATRDYLRSVLAALADAVVVIDSQGRVEFANQAACDLLDQEQAKLVGRPASSLWGDPDQASLFEGQRLEELFGLGGFQRTDMVLRTKAGHSIPVSWSASVMRAGQDATRLVGIARDVRIERRLEQDKLRHVRELAASVAHEIRNPLGAIQNSVSLLRRDLAMEEEDRTLLDIILGETERMGKIVTQFLDFGRPIHPEFEEADLKILLRDLLRLAEQDERVLAGCQLLIHADEELPPITFDPGLVKQVLWNLLTNALDAAKESVAVRLRPSQGGGVEVRVADDGPGIPPEVLARAFEPFKTTKATGSGLGLPISKRIVEAHGGTLRLESAQGTGTTASFTLPAPRKGSS
jgi:two-component system, sporulation sensor kinase E